MELTHRVAFLRRIHAYMRFKRVIIEDFAGSCIREIVFYLILGVALSGAIWNMFGRSVQLIRPILPTVLPAIGPDFSSSEVSVFDSCVLLMRC